MQKSVNGDVVDRPNEAICGRALSGGVWPLYSGRSMANTTIKEAGGALLEGFSRCHTGKIHTWEEAT